MPNPYNLSDEQMNSVPIQYAIGVLNGFVPVGKKIKTAVQRFFKWLENAEKDGFYLNHKKGMHIIDFFPTFINHIEGDLAGKPFHLAPFQQFTMYNVFGWMNKDGKRRIKTVYDKRAKKNGKTAEMAGLALYCLSFDEEFKAQIYIGATKEEQAKLCWSAARDMITSFAANPYLRKMGFETQQKHIFFRPTNSFMAPLGGDSKTQDGVNAHVSIIDEYHAHKDDSVKENLESSAVQRSQPLTWHITTAGTNIASVCKKYEDSVIEVLEGRNIDESLWVMIHDLDDPEQWDKEEFWYQANPLLGQGLKIERLRDEFVKVQNQPAKIPNFKTKHLNMWVDAPSIWIPTEIWRKCKTPLTSEEVLEKFRKHTGVMALDLSTTTDLTAVAMISEPDENEYRELKVLLFCPEDTIEKRSREDRVPYRYWRDAGFLISTPGNVVDHKIIEQHIRVNHGLYNIRFIERDRYMATNITSNLQEDGYVIHDFVQTITNYSFPTKEFERMIHSELLRHDGNPTLEWMLSGCRVIQDSNENIRIHKGESNKHTKRVDGIIASIMALGGSLTFKEESNKSIYDSDDVEFEC